MKIVELIDAGLSACVKIETAEQYNKLAPYFRNGGAKPIDQLNEPLYAFSLYSAFRGNIGLGYSSSPEFNNRQIPVIDFDELEFE